MAGSYPLPNDDAELERMDIKHHCMRLLCSGHLHLAPLNNPKIILDVGTGTGIWAIEMAEHYPDTTIIGTDLSPVQPEMVPHNVHFEIDDLEVKQWAWPDNYFDYIHSRFMIASVGNWQRYIRKIYRHTKPGGYFELQELNCRFHSDDGSVKKDSSLAYWSEMICLAAEKYNRPIPIHTDYVAMLEKAGFVEIRQVILKSPSNPWPKDKNLKEVGKFQSLALLEGLEGISLALMTRGLKWKADEVKVLIAKVRNELKDRTIHSYQPKVVVVGRKPVTPLTPDSTVGLSVPNYSRTLQRSSMVSVGSDSYSQQSRDPQSSDHRLSDSDSMHPPATPLNSSTTTTTTTTNTNTTKSCPQNSSNATAPSVTNERKSKVTKR